MQAVTKVAKACQRRSNKGLMSFPKNQQEVAQILHELNFEDPISCEATSLDYQYDYISREAETVPADYTIMSPPKTNSFEDEHIIAGIRMDYFYYQWIPFHSSNAATVKMFEQAGVPQASMDISPTQQASFIMLENMEELEAFTTNFREGIATITAQYLFVHQVFRGGRWIYPQGAPRYYKQEPLYSLVYAGVPTRVAYEKGVPLYLMDHQELIHYQFARAAFARLAARSTNEELKKELKEHSSEEELKEFQYEEDAIFMEKNFPLELTQEQRNDLAAITQWGSTSALSDEEDLWEEDGKKFREEMVLRYPPAPKSKWMEEYTANLMEKRIEGKNSPLQKIRDGRKQELMVQASIPMQLYLPGERAWRENYAKHGENSLQPESRWSDEEIPAAPKMGNKDLPIMVDSPTEEEKQYPILEESTVYPMPPMEEDDCMDSDSETEEIYHDEELDTWYSIKKGQHTGPLAHSYEY